MIGGAVRHLKRQYQAQYPTQIQPEKGSTKLSPELLGVSRHIGAFLVDAALADESLRLPDTTERQKELESLVGMLFEALSHHEGNIRFVAPVCPDYSQESSDTFYQTIGKGISPQARAAMRAAVQLVELCQKNGFTPQIDILIADTEDDLPEVIDRCVGGSVTEYQQRCQASVTEIREQMLQIPQVSVSTFTQALGADFRFAQYAYEGIIGNLRLSNSKIATEVEKMGAARTNRHSKILGRPEQDYELTVRYMAQYAALGTLLRQLHEPTILLNYPTPNLPFFNAASYRSAEFSFSAKDTQVMPVIVTVL